jgi:biotin operon repressor
MMAKSRETKPTPTPTAAAAKPIRPTGGVPKGYKSSKVAAVQSDRRFMVAVLLRRLHSGDAIANELSKAPKWRSISRATVIRDLRYLMDEGVAVQIRIGRFWKGYHVDNAPHAKDFPEQHFKRTPNGRAKENRRRWRNRLRARLTHAAEKALDTASETE